MILLAIRHRGSIDVGMGYLSSTNLFLTWQVEGYIMPGNRQDDWTDYEDLNSE